MHGGVFAHPHTTGPVLVGHLKSMQNIGNVGTVYLVLLTICKCIVTICKCIFTIRKCIFTMLEGIFTHFHHPKADFQLAWISLLSAEHPQPAPAV